MQRSEESAIVQLTLVPVIGPRRFKNLVNHFGSAAEAVRAKAGDLAGVEDISRELAEKIAAGIAAADPDAEQERARNAGAAIITCVDESYPETLKILDDAPPLIYVRGTLSVNDLFSVAIVGTRHPTNYGAQAAAKFSRELSERGVAVVSGLARGIDTYAHAAAVDCGGRTIAVLGNGLNVHYPPENRKLEESILRNGALVSEFPMRTEPDKVNFPRRNRLIAGLSLATVVVESAIKSGALITAKFALEQGKDVFAVPGPVFSKYSEGPHYLIKSGAYVAESAADIIETIAPLAEWLKNRTRAASTVLEPEILDDRLQSILTAIATEIDGVSIDYLNTHVPLSPGELSKGLLSLELQGRVCSLPGKRYAIKQ